MAERRDSLSPGPTAAQTGCEAASCPRRLTAGLLGAAPSPRPKVPWDAPGAGRGTNPSRSRRHEQVVPAAVLQACCFCSESVLVNANGGYSRGHKDHLICLRSPREPGACPWLGVRLRAGLRGWSPVGHRPGFRPQPSRVREAAHQPLASLMFLPLPLPSLRSIKT